ncbi:MAG: Uncharacterised protein [Cellvibrionales bacterium UBA7375]|nr:MAG: Uncharacterised protein [Cellvibrionales bacterium UBA7375]
MSFDTMTLLVYLDEKQMRIFDITLIYSVLF